MTEKHLPQPSSPETGRRTFTPYVTVWTVLAALSLVYLGLIVTQPATVAGVLGASDHAAYGDGPETLAETAAEVRTLRDTIDLFRNELIEMRAQVSNQTDVTSELLSRIATLETSPDGAARVAEANGARGQDTAATGQQPPTETAALPAPIRKNAGETSKAAKQAEAKAKSRVETGSVSAPATGAGSEITFGAPVVKQAATPPSDPPPGTRNMIGVQIATGPSVDSLRLSWTLLSERHADSFRALAPRYVASGSGPNESYDLIVGPMPTVDEARRLCEDLSLKATPCRVSQFTGDAL
ncbi:hypothetical protein W911_10300 [Hyphomicrobium nitrativorans NL23]|uniref:SPOR domain-containing protein n=1 Tax=Hyphomicrobium nitrativorans NL23 TaxID=1029756 RepID=V5SJB5_9HYPH|nr:hypothetical protein [Hyphomicrobium nitrativorans]AHB50185.1 hypothetical protein W911_10300 [Hyphomicrobium nitrativorans NL23]